MVTAEIVAATRRWRLAKERRARALEDEDAAWRTLHTYVVDHPEDLEAVQDLMHRADEVQVK